MSLCQHLQAKILKLLNFSKKYGTIISFFENRGDENV